MVTGAVRRTAAAAAAACLLSSCAPAAAPVVWRQVALPAGARPASLAALGADLLVGGALGTTPRPLLVRLDATGRVHELPLLPGGGYADTADLVSLSPLGDDLLALGVDRGGAHGNQRWTFWQGPATGPLRDHDQAFSTFGGHEAGPLLGIVGLDGRPVVVGSRGGRSGFDAALWTLRGTTWTRRPAVDPLLASSPDRVLTFRAAGSTGTSLVIVGAETGLAGEVRQAPMLWAGRPDAGWRAIPLEIPDQLATATGLAQATSLACGTASCWVAGWVRGSPVVWQVDLAAQTSNGVVLPGTGGSATDPLAVVAVAGELPVVVTNADDPLTAWLCRGEWRTAAAPPGRTIALAALGGRLYAATGDPTPGLWEGRLDPGAC